MSAQTHRDRMTTQAQDLVAKLMPLLTQADDLRAKIDNPICGKPGKGFKAARKLKPQLQALDAQIATVNTEIDVWFTRNGKADKQERGRRFDVYAIALREWQAERLAEEIPDRTGFSALID